MYVDAPPSFLWRNMLSAEGDTRYLAFLLLETLHKELGLDEETYMKIQNMKLQYIDNTIKKGE